jgi:xanthine dehydrogenase accessory factor
MERARRVLAEGRPTLASYGIDDAMGFAVGLSCGGSIDVLIEPHADDEAWREFRAAVASERPVAMATALAPEPLLGARRTFTDGGPGIGSLPPELGPALDEAARPLLLDGGTRLLRVAWRAAEAEIFLEAVAPPPRLYLVGATHIAAALCRMARAVGFRVTVVDARSAFASEERFPDAESVMRSWPDEAFAELPLDAYTYVVTLTHDPKFDLPALQRALRAGARYVGALGSRRTHAARLDALRSAGLSEAELARIHAPIGLDLGGRAPEEIALAILAEIVAVRHGRRGAPLREREGRIHPDA